MARRRFFQMPAIDQPDPEPGYQHSSDEFIIPSIDEEGNSDRCQFRAPTTLLGWMEDIVSSGQFPFRRVGDLMRYGSYLACVQLSRIERHVPSLQAKLDAANAVVRRRQAAAGVSEHLDHVASLVADLQKKKAYGEICYLLAGEQRSATEAIADEPYWGQVWLDSLHDRFADIRALAESKLEPVNLKPSAATAAGENRQ